MNEHNYLGEEKVGKLLAKFAVPCICSLIISCLYNIVDQIFVGHGVNSAANAATGIIFPVTVLGWGFSLLFGDGVAAWLSISLGEKKTDKIHRGVGNAILFSFFSGCLLILVAYLWGDNLLKLIGAKNEAVLQYAHDYSIIIYAMIPLALVQNSLAAIIRADGSPKYSMVAMIAGAVINIIGDPVAIYGMHLGIRGAAYATILGQFVSFLICAAYLFKSKTFRITFKSFIPDFKLVGRISQLGISSFLTQLSIVIITIVNNILLVRFGSEISAEYGSTIALAAFVVIMKLFQIVLNIAIGIAAGAQPIVGYNYGAGNYERVKKLLKLILIWTGGICLACTFFFEVIPKVFIGMFGTGADDTVVDKAQYAKDYMEYAVKCLRIYLSLITLTCLQKVCSIFLQSIGKANLAAPLSFLRDILLILFSASLPFIMGVTGVFWGAPIADILAGGITAAIMASIWKKLSKEQKKE